MRLELVRIFPFDSGAFDRGFYDKYLHQKMVLGDFALDADISTPGRVITRFFGDVPNYLRGTPSSSQEGLDPSSFEAFSYIGLISAKDSNLLDSRSSSIELQTSEALDITFCVEAVILPAPFCEGETGGSLRNLGIELLPYRVHDRFRAGEYISEISTVCLNYYIRKGLVSEDAL